jgi:hypothetical protein
MLLRCIGDLGALLCSLRIQRDCSTAREEASGGPVLQPPTGHGNTEPLLARATAMRRKKKKKRGWRKKKREAAPFIYFWLRP